MMHKEDFEIGVNGVVIKGWAVVPPTGANAPNGIVVLCHGIPGGPPNPSDSGYAHLAKSVADDGHGVAFFNFRGAGDSGGDFDIRGWVDDLKGVIAWVRRRFSSSLILFGFSAGGAVAVHVAKTDPGIGGLILCATPARFARVLDVEGPDCFLEHARRIGIIRHPDFPARRSEWTNGFRQVCAEEDLCGCGPVPTLIIHGDEDDTVPVAHAYRLYAAAPGPKKLVVVQGGGHRLRLNEEAMQVAREWLLKLQGIGGQGSGDG